MAIVDSSVPRTFGEILGGLMGAVIDAQTQAARATVDFIEDVGTKDGSIDSDTAHELRNIKFNYTKKNEFDEEAVFTLEIPILSLVEIPAINIKTAKFSFNYDVTNTDQTSTEEESSSPSPDPNTSTKKKWFQVRKPIKVIGRVKRESKTTSTANTNAGINVEVEFEKSSHSIGMERVIDMLELSATDKQKPKNDTNG